MAIPLHAEQLSGSRSLRVLASAYDAVLRQDSVYRRTVRGVASTRLFFRGLRSAPGRQHDRVSNMNAARANPGLDGHVFYLGLMRRRTAPR